jgi:hypothetical protein
LLDLLPDAPQRRFPHQIADAAAASDNAVTLPTAPANVPQWH